MQRSFFFKLMGAFVLVILLLAVVVAMLVNQATSSQFRLYSDHNGQLWAAQLAPQLAAYYSRQGSWQGVETVLRSSGGMSTDMEMMGSDMMSPGMGMMGDMMSPLGASRGGQWGGNSAGTDMWTMMGVRIILADAGGQVISDSADLLTGQTLPSATLVSGAPVQINGRVVGTVIGATPANAPATSPAGAFLKEVNRSILLAVLVTGLAALALGALLFFQMTAPIRQLTAAANAIAAGNLSQRVDVRTGDELGELAHAFNTMAGNLAASEAQRRKMVADVAHEFRTPLSVLQANLEAMQDGVLPTDSEQLASLHEETLLLSRLVTDLRLLSIAESGQLKLESSEIDLCELVHKSCERMRPAAQAQGINLTQKLPAVAPVLADAGRLTQVIGNLVDNALRHTPAGGAVTLQVGLTGTEHIPVAPLQPESEYYIVTVTDTGAGIPWEDMPHVFDRFYRVDKSRTRASGGSGLGLAIAKHLVEAHGGRIWAESPIYHTDIGTGYGTRLAFTLPVLV